MAEIVQLKSADEKSLGEINALLRQLSERAPACTSGLLTDIVGDQNLELWVVKDADIVVGMGELAIILKPEGTVARFEDFVVAESQRGKGLGTMILEKLIERARARGARAIQLSSRAERTAANALYQKLGFKVHETNSYYMNL